MFVNILLLLASGLAAAGLAQVATAYLQRTNTPRPESFFLLLGFTGSLIIGVLLSLAPWVTGLFNSVITSPEFGAGDFHLMTNTLVTAVALWLIDPDRHYPLRRNTSLELTTSLLTFSWAKIRRSRPRQHTATAIPIGDNQ